MSLCPAADDTRNGSVPDAAGAPGAADVFQNVQICCFLQYLATRVTLLRDVFVDLFMDLSSKTPTFESLFGGFPARNPFKSGCFR